MSYYIYKICCDDLPDFVYVGSTKAFRQRKQHHKDNYNKGDTKKLYTTIRENGGWDNWRMVIIEECGEITFTEARIKEEEHRVKLNANLNMQKCYTTKEERKEYNKNYMKNYERPDPEYKKKHKQLRYKCECGREIVLDNKARHEKTNLHLKKLEKLEN